MLPSYEIIALFYASTARNAILLADLTKQVTNLNNQVTSLRGQSTQTQKNVQSLQNQVGNNSVRISALEDNSRATTSTPDSTGQNNLDDRVTTLEGKMDQVLEKLNATMQRGNGSWSNNWKKGWGHKAATCTCNCGRKNFG